MFLRSLEDYIKNLAAASFQLRASQETASSHPSKMRDLSKIDCSSWFGYFRSSLFHQLMNECEILKASFLRQMSKARSFTSFRRFALRAYCRH